MDFSEMFQSVRDALTNAWRRVSFVVRTHALISLFIFLLLGGGLVVWARSGFTVQLSRFFAAGTPTPSPTPTTHTPWFYCDYTTKAGACVQSPPNGNGVSEDFDAPDCSSGGGACALGNCRKWEGSGGFSGWHPGSAPANVPACEPIRTINTSSFPDYRDPALNPAPTDFPNCLVLENRDSNDPNWATMTENIVPAVLGGRLYLKRYVVNNCPWTVHLVFQMDGGPKASFTQGAGSRSGLSDSELSKALTATNLPDGYDFPSCWNSGGARPASCGREVTIEYNLNTYTCGSLGVSIYWWHLTGNNSAHQVDSRGVNYISSINYGRDCTGSSVERAPGNLKTTPATGGGCGEFDHASVKPPVLTVQCGTSTNILNWQKPTTLHLNMNRLGRVELAPGQPLLTMAQIEAQRVTPTNGFIYQEGVCPAFLQVSSFVDSKIKAGYTYEYYIEGGEGPEVDSNIVVCNGGQPVAVSPSQSPVLSSLTPLPSAYSASPTPPLSYLTPTPYYSNGIYITPTPYSYYPTPTPYYLTPLPSSGTTTATGTVAGVQTGPGDVTLLALIISSLVSLLYISYTHSARGRRREAEDISRDQGPMDFRS